MSGILLWLVSLLVFPPEEHEMSERTAPPGFEGELLGPGGHHGPR